MKTSLTLAALPLLLLSVESPACTCGVIQKPYAERRLDYARVFHGRVLANEPDSARYSRSIRFALIKDYGVKAWGSSETVTVWTSLYDSNCGVDYPVGWEVIVFADTATRPEEKGDFTTHLCRMNVVGDLTNALRELDAAVGVRDRGGGKPASRTAATVDCGQVWFGGEVKVKANGARSSILAR